MVVVIPAAITVEFELALAVVVDEPVFVTVVVEPPFVTVVV